MPYDLVSLGEVLLRLSPPGYVRLRRATQLEVHLGGSQLNVAANLAQLGRSTALVTKLPANELGMLAQQGALSYGVDMSHVTMVRGARMGVYYLEHGSAPRVGAFVYDRAGSAASTTGPGDFEWAAIVQDARVAYTDGIMPGLSPSCLEASIQFLKAARDVGCLTVFDVNYREHLWTAPRARAAWSRILPYVDAAITNRGVSESVFGYRGTDEELMHRYTDAFGCATICLTTRESPSLQRGAWSSMALHGGTVYRGRRFEFDIVDRIGAGDAFDAGFIHGYLLGNVEHALHFGNALCALAHTAVGDIAQASRAEVEAILSGDLDLTLRR